MPYCDLHTHCTASDGTDAPEDLPRLAKDAGLSAFALTDHDTTAGLGPCAAAATRLDIDFVPGIEISADPASVSGVQRAGAPARGTLHLLGLFIAYQGPAAEKLAVIQKRLVQAREQRNPQMIAKLNDLGVNITYDEVLQVAHGDIVGRPHIAQIMLKKGYVKSIHEAFARYLGQSGAAYVRRDRLAAAQVIEAIHDANGLAGIAHPLQLALPEVGAIEHVITRLKDMGLDAIETRHSDHSPAQVERFGKLADRLHLLVTGGSDYHGSRKAIDLGSQHVPVQVYQSLRQHWQAR